MCIFAFSSKGYVALSRKLYYFLSALFKSRTAVEQVIVLEMFQALLAKILIFPFGTCPCVYVWEEPQVRIWNLIQGHLESVLDGDIWMLLLYQLALEKWPCSFFWLADLPQMLLFCLSPDLFSKISVVKSEDTTAVRRDSFSVIIWQ